MKETYLDYYYAKLLPKSIWRVITPSLESRDLNITPQEAGDLFSSGIQYTERGPLESYQISMSYYDTPGTIVWHDRKFPYLKTGDFLFLDCTPGYRVDTNGEGHSMFIHFWGENIRYYYDRFIKLNSGSPIARRDSPVVERNLKRLIDIYQKPNDYYTDLLAETLIMEMVLDCINAVLPKHTTYSEYIQSLLGVIHQRYHENLSLDALADEVHISKYYLCRIFKKEVGQTPANYIKQFRLGKAKELLRFTNLSQEAICAKVGIYNCSYLCKLFRLYENTTPDQYRKRWQ